MRRVVLCRPTLLLLPLWLASAPFVYAADPPVPAADPLVTIDFPDDGIDLTLLADIVTRRLHVPILYDETVRGKKVIVRVPSKVPESALMGILQSALRLKQLALVDAGQPGWKQIVPAPNLAAVARLPDGDATSTADGPVTQAFLLEHADATKVAEAVRPLLTQPGGSVNAQAGQKLLLVSDYAAVVRRAGDLIKQLDTQAPAVVTRFVPLAHAEAAAVATAVTQLVSSREAFQWGSPAGSGVSVTADERANQLIVIAPPGRTDEIDALIQGLDKAPDGVTRVYRLKTLNPDRAELLVRTLVGPAQARIAADRDSQSLAVSATSAVHEKIDAFLKQADTPAPESASPIRFYKLRNTKAADVLATISGLLGGDTQQPSNVGAATPAQQSNGLAGASNALSNAPANSTANGAAGALANVDTSSALGNRGSSFSRSGLANGAGGNTGASGLLDSSSNGGSYSDRSQRQSSTAGVLAVRGKDATVAADVNTNSIIVIGPPAVQQTYADLVKRLDQRRPQVQIECTIVTLDTTGNTTFGVDIGKLGGFDSSRLLTLSSFGISTADPSTGRLTPVGGTGGTFALLSPGIADVVLRALQTDSHARLVSAPQLLVNDNGVGKLESVSQQPYAVILDASSVQSITSLGGLASAGTSISVEPHISEADYLQLGYSIELSSFTGAAQNGLPPPSEKNSVDSDVTIPDGYTIVVGGLSTQNNTRDRSTIPLLGDIPILGWLFGTHTNSNRNTTLFVFIKPVILRDDKFEDLKYLSTRATAAAGVKDDFPVSKPVALR